MLLFIDYTQNNKFLRIFNFIKKYTDKFGRIVFYLKFKK